MPRQRLERGSLLTQRRSSTTPTASEVAGGVRVGVFGGACGGGGDVHVHYHRPKPHGDTRAVRGATAIRIPPVRRKGETQSPEKESAEHPGKAFWCAIWQEADVNTTSLLYHIRCRDWTSLGLMKVALCMVSVVRSGGVWVAQIFIFGHWSGHT